MKMPKLKKKITEQKYDKLLRQFLPKEVIQDLDEFFGVDWHEDYIEQIKDGSVKPWSKNKSRKKKSEIIIL